MTNKHMKRCSASLITREMQVKITVRYYFTLLGYRLTKKQKIASIGEDVKKLEPLCVAGRNIKWCSFCRKQLPQKCKHRITIWSRISTSEYIPQGTESRDLNRYLYTHFHSGIIQYSQKVQTTCGIYIQWNIIQP